MKYFCALVAVIAVVVSVSASAREADVVVGLDQACPAGTTSKGPSYRWNGGGFVREGWVCESLQGKN